MRRGLSDLFTLACLVAAAATAAVWVASYRRTLLAVRRPVAAYQTRVGGEAQVGVGHGTGQVAWWREVGTDPAAALRAAAKWDAFDEPPGVPYWADPSRGGGVPLVPEYAVRCENRFHGWAVWEHHVRFRLAEPPAVLLLLAWPGVAGWRRRLRGAYRPLTNVPVSEPTRVRPSRF